MNLCLILTFALVFAVHGESLDVDRADDIEQPKAVLQDSLDDRDAFNNELLEDDQNLEDDNIESLVDPDALEAYEESNVEQQNDPYVYQTIEYYCKFCKVCKACKKFGRCNRGTINKACGGCKYCEPKTYWNMVRRIRIRIRLRRVGRWGRRRRRRRRG